MNSSQPSDRNAFLAELSPADYELFRPHLTGFTLTIGERLQDFGTAVEQVVFPHGGLVALTIPLRSGHGSGAILAGRDSFVGAFDAAATAPAMCDAEVYIGGRAARMPASAFRSILDQSPAISRVAARYMATLIMQSHQTALCNATHAVERRISRWLLEILDRSGGFDVPLTQGTLAQMIGVQRTTVNLAAGRLQEAGIINCRRGDFQIVRREQLEQRACECYRNMRSYVSRLHDLPTVPVATEPSDRKAVSSVGQGLSQGSNPLRPGP